MAEISGWYYDLQQKYDTTSRLTTVSLHANSKYIGKDKWIYAEKNKDNEYGEVDEDGYFKEPICTSILNEEFNVSAANSWSDMGSDGLGELWGTVRSLAPYAEKVIQGIDDIVTAQENLTDADRKEIEGSVAGQMLMSFSSKLRNFVMNGNPNTEGGNDNKTKGEAWAAKYLNSAVSMTGSRYTMYQGTNLSFSNMTMKFTLIPIWDKYGKFHTVHDQLNDIYPYFFGEYIPADFSDFFDNAAGRHLASKICWQRPPGGYQSNADDLDSAQKGSLKLKIGAYYSLANVVVDNITLNFSKQMIKNPKAVWNNFKNSKAEFDYNSQYISPMSCDVSLTLRPCTKYSLISLKNFVEGRGMKQELNYLTGTLQHKLEDEMKGNFDIYNSLLTDSDEYRDFVYKTVNKNNPDEYTFNEEEEEVDEELNRYLEEYKEAELLKSMSEKERNDYLIKKHNDLRNKEHNAMSNMLTPTGNNVSQADIDHVGSFLKDGISGGATLNTSGNNIDWSQSSF